MTGTRGRHLEAEPDGGVVVGHSRHRGSDDAVLVAARLAVRLAVPLHIVHVVATDDFPIDPDSWNWETDAARAVEEQAQALLELLAHAPVVWDRRVRQGDPASVLLVVAEEVDAPFVVVGTHGTGRARVQSALLGHRSVSKAAIGRGSRPVLVVPAGSAGTSPWRPAGPAGRHERGRDLHRSRPGPPR
ncbi:universal stress protein [Actinomycetospora endophytica]|uniref:Universal stress protein n=1 Tax=Actinomycetospora endophytica TaxID=2291215 RepID=A0ABS8PAJ0_9PSEU|nr:universal stress protein [Actinomycetospora endophytica]MCD2195269.1 universal stress protein [Actinomycetospora endophytica]